MSNNCEGIIVDMDCYTPDMIRLQEIGICSGCHIKVLCAGESCLLKINNKKICLRTENLNNVFVCPFIEDAP